jgi:hypothetical protein
MTTARGNIPRCSFIKSHQSVIPNQNFHCLNPVNLVSSCWKGRSFIGWLIFYEAARESYLFKVAQKGPDARLPRS